MAEVGGQGPARQLRDGPGQLDPRRPAPDDHEGQEPPLRARIGPALGPLEGQEDAPADAGRVVQLFQPRRRRLPVIVSEVVVARAGREDQVIVGDGLLPEGHGAALYIHARDLAQEHAGIALAAQHAPDRPGDIARRQRRGRDLVEQGLEEMIIPAVDDGDLDRRARERLRRPHPGEAGTHDHDPRSWPDLGRGRQELRTPNPRIAFARIDFPTFGAIYPDPGGPPPSARCVTSPVFYCLVRRTGHPWGAVATDECPSLGNGVRATVSPDRDAATVAADECE